MTPRNPVIIRPDTSIGENNAENDFAFLHECFLDHPAFAAISDPLSPKLVLSGRTGSGKTAILSMIEKQNENVSVIELQDMALDYVANSTIIQFLNALEFDLDIFFQALWKHVLCIEFIRLRYSITSEEKSNYIFAQFKKFFARNDRKNAALNYLSEWEGKFWISMDENIKEITNRFERKISAEFGAEIEKFSTNAGFSRTLGVEKKSQLIARIKKIINPSQLAELHRVLDVLSEYDDSQKYMTYYILIDRLDEKWVDEDIRYTLIRALIESLRAFRKIHSLKIVVTLRTDVLERVVIENQDLGFQREKYDDYFLRILWKKEQLKELVQKRINFLYRRKYTSENVFFEDIFRTKIKGKSPFDFLVERTLYRPRDIIAFVNLCLIQSQGNSEVFPKNITQAENEYSRVRLQSLIYEWKSAFPSLEIVFRLMSGMNERFSAYELASLNFVDTLALEYDMNSMVKFDPIYERIRSHLAEQSDATAHRLGKTLISELYRIGAIGIKLSSGERYVYSFKDNPILNEESINLDNKLHIHPMLHRALGVDKSNRNESQDPPKRPLTVSSATN